MRESSMPRPDRRQSPRTKLVEIAYIGMGPENGGLVLDVSNGGLSFHAVAPVQRADTIHFLLSLRDQTRIEGAGEVVWTDEMRTVCGLRFTSLTTDAREFLNNWTNPSRLPAPARETSVSAAPPATSPTEHALPALASRSDTDAEPLFAIPPVDQIHSSESEARPFWQGPIFSWIMFGILCAALTLAAFNYGVHVGKSQTGSAAQSVANPSPQKEPGLLPPAPVPAPSAASGSPSAPAVATPGPGDTPLNPPETVAAIAKPSPLPGAEENAAAGSDQHAEQAFVAGKSQLAAALAFLNGGQGQRDSSQAARLLWAAVGNGNSDAEVILAGLYLTGDGVAKNCEQGRVLLIAAAKSGNAQAKVKLDEWNANGCS